MLQTHNDRVVFHSKANPQLTSSQVRPLGLCLNEMATNGAKYGALSVPEGKVSLSWDVQTEGERRVLSLVWIEENGPEVTQPDHDGFGTSLIKHSIFHDLDGDIDIVFDRSGLNVRIRIPMETERE